MLLERILLNLVSNAVRYTLRGGIMVSDVVGAVKCCVLKYGIAVPADFNKTFGEFFNFKRNRYGGLGLGLVSTGFAYFSTIKSTWLRLWAGVHNSQSSFRWLMNASRPTNSLTHLALRPLRSKAR